VSGPLSAEQQQQLQNATGRARKVHSAARMAAFNGWVSAVLAVVSVPFAWHNLPALFAVVGLALVAYREFRGRRMLLRFESHGARLLGWNQLGLLALIIVYCLWMTLNALLAPSPMIAELRSKPELAGLLGSPAELEQMYRLLTLTVYGAVVALSCVFQGLNAAYYFSRRRYLDAYLQETPDWVIKIQQLSSAT
jgi:hypothetical protein